MSTITEQRRKPTTDDLAKPKYKMVTENINIYYGGVRAVKDLTLKFPSVGRAPSAPVLR